MLRIWNEQDIPNQVRDIVEGLTEPLEQLSAEHDVVTLHAPIASERNYLLRRPNDVVLMPHLALVTGTGNDRLHESAITLPLQVCRHELPQHLANPKAWPAGRQVPGAKETAT
jgi:phosphoglycerate dehydrogenase-like enzyme